MDVFNAILDWNDNGQKEMKSREIVKILCKFMGESPQKLGH